jgi:hypothetical protein
MALLVGGICSRCKKLFECLIGSGETTPNICPTCKNDEKMKKDKEYFDELDNLTVSERIRRLEEWVHNYKPYREIRF